jgi:hypothetical protein
VEGKKEEDRKEMKAGEGWSGARGEWRGIVHVLQRRTFCVFFEGVE